MCFVPVITIFVVNIKNTVGSGDQEVQVHVDQTNCCHALFFDSTLEPVFPLEIRVHYF